MSEATPRNPEFEADIRASFARQGVMASFGARLARIAPGTCEIEVPWRPELTQQHGYFHAGVIATAADSAGGYAALSLLPKGADVLAVEFKINLMSPGEGELLVARGRVAKSGRTLTVCTVEVDVIRDGVARSCAIMQQTVFNLPPR
ncbi:PaaI family thioesterase [Arenibaculum pallidiluteum]|uniref:PaaI family thioesterase n=1 Tax=Arenibaculum pallidiluteum TaxID=2812559 RepID=UPI001F15E77B|nr:PaaI family thioesterase [Arenibaculum pallidiluteum]